MVSSIKKYSIIIGLCVVSFVLGKYSDTQSVNETQTSSSESHEVTHIQTNEIGEVTEKETRQLDGTVQIERKTVYNRRSVEDTSTHTETQSTSSKASEGLPEHQVTIMYSLSQTQDQYILSYQRRIFSSLYAGAYVRPSVNYEYGLVVSLGF